MGPAIMKSLVKCFFYMWILLIISKKTNWAIVFREILCLTTCMNLYASSSNGRYRVEKIIYLTSARNISGSAYLHMLYLQR